MRSATEILWFFLTTTLFLEVVRRWLVRYRIARKQRRLRPEADPTLEPVREPGNAPAKAKLHLQGCQFRIHAPAYVTVRLYRNELIARTIAGQDDIVIPCSDGKAWLVSLKAL